MAFIDSFIQRGNSSFEGMRDEAVDELSDDRIVLDRLHKELERGIGILQDEPHLNMYLRSFGKMHKAKLDAAFHSFPDLNQAFSQKVHVYDWGFGQGTASICLLDFLRDKGYIGSVTKITLTDPSDAAVGRAKDVIKCYDPNIKITPVVKFFDD